MLAEREEIYFHTPARFAGAFPYKALVAGARVALPEEPPIRKRFHQHVLVHTTSGRGLIEVRGQRFVAEEGLSVWLDTSQAYEHRCAPDAREWRYLWMGVEGHGLDEVYAFLNVQQSPLFEPSDREAARVAFQAVIGYLDDRSSATDALVSAAIAGLIANLSAPRLVGAAAPDDSASRDRITSVLAAVRKDLAKAWTIDELAVLAHLSPSQLFRDSRTPSVRRRWTGCAMSASTRQNVCWSSRRRRFRQSRRTAAIPIPIISPAIFAV